jgi:long-chain acyl-CoA synthetase
MTVQTLGELCLEGARRYKSRKALELCRGDRLLETLSYRTLAFRARQVAGLFRSLGLGRGARIMILAENRPEWPIAIFGAALAGAASLPLSPRAAAACPPLAKQNPGPPGPLGSLGPFGEGLAALCVTKGTAELAAALDPALPRIYLDSPLGEGQPAWTSMLVSLGGVAKRLPLSPRPDPAASVAGALSGPEPGDTALLWPDGTQSSHRELLSLAAAQPRLFPRDRLLPLCSLAETGALVLAVLAAVRGGASLSCVEGVETDTAEPARALALLHPTVLVGDAAFLETLYRDKAALLAKGPLSRLIIKPLARHLGGRRFIKALGGNIRFFGFTGGSEPGEKMKELLRRVHLPNGPANRRL